MAHHTFQTMERKVIDDLEWYWNQSDAELGERSNWIDVRNFKFMGSSEWKDPFSIRHMVVISKRRQIVKSLNKLSELQQQILFAQFGSYKTTYYFTSSMPSSDTERTKYMFIYKFFQHMSPTAVIIADMSIEALNDLCKKKAKEKVQAAYVLHHIKQLANREYKLAIVNFYKNRGTSE